jgi:peptidoglycan hydrolase-like protein with peptidoglycan-binding domain
VEVTVPTTDAVNTSCHLQKGYANEAVRVLQEDLVHCHHQGISIDAQFGTQTKTALQNVQRSLGLNDDGVYGPYTRDAMHHLATYSTNCYRYNGPGGS